MLSSGHSTDIEYRTLRRLFYAYLFFIIYGSFIPFHFNLDPNFVRWRFGIFVSESLYRNLEKFSGSDVLVNVLIYIPLGVLLTATWYKKQATIRWTTTPWVVGITGLLIGLAIELGQTLCPYRSPSMLDAFCNGTGMLIGALVSSIVLPRLHGSLGRRIGALIREKPLGILLGFLMLAPLADAFYPFDARSTIGFFADNLAMGRLTFFHNGAVAINLFIEKFASFTALGFFLIAHRRRIAAPIKGSHAALVWVIFAAMIETAKLVFTMRIFRAENILFALLGASTGIALERQFADRGIANPRNLLILIGIAIGLLGYFQMEPFDWISRQELSWKIRQIEWFPFAAYYWSDPRLALFDLLKKLNLSIPIGLLIGAFLTKTNHRPRGAAVALVTLLGVVFEACQIFIRSRYPSVTDVAVIAMGGWIGVSAELLYQKLKTHE